VARSSLELRAERARSHREAVESQLEKHVPAIRQCRDSRSDCCDSSFCFTVTRTRSSEERVLFTATLRTLPPFQFGKPRLFRPFDGNDVEATTLRFLTQPVRSIAV
jgi:hypothetical protein